MNIEYLKKYKTMLIKEYDCSKIENETVTFYGAILNDISKVPFHFADRVEFVHNDSFLTVRIYQKTTSEPIIIENLS